MITHEDCIAFSALTDAEVLADAEHEHIPEAAAAALAQYHLSREHGAEAIRGMIVDDIRAAQGRDNKQHVQTLIHVLHHFLRDNPEAVQLCIHGAANPQFARSAIGRLPTGGSSP